MRPGGSAVSSGHGRGKSAPADDTCGGSVVGLVMAGAHSSAPADDAQGNPDKVTTGKSSLTTVEAVSADDVPGLDWLWDPACVPLAPLSTGFCAAASVQSASPRPRSTA